MTFHSSALPITPRGDLTHLVQTHAAHASVEVIPQTINDTIAKRLAGRDVFIAALPHAPYRDVLTCAETLVRHGANPVIHLPVRRFKTLDDIDAVLDSYQTIGGKSILLIAGDNQTPAGAVASTLPVLESGIIQDRKIRKVFFAGHPQGNPNTSPEHTQAALTVKLDWAQRSPTIKCGIIGQMCFDAAPLLQWADELCNNDVTLPLYAGVHAPTSLRQLTQIAMKVGLKFSARMAQKRDPADHAKMLLGADALIGAAVTSGAFTRLHFYGFSTITNTIDYLDKLQQGHPKTLAPLLASAMPTPP